MVTIVFNKGDTKNMTDTSNLAIIARNNIKALCEEKKIKKKQIAELCGVRASSVTKWLGDPPILPSVEYLYILANHFGVTIDWLLSDHSFEKITGRLTKYNQAFIALTSLVDNETLKPEDLNDPVLRYLEQHYQDLRNSDTSEEEINTWIKKTLTNYDIKLPTHTYDPFTGIDAKTLETMIPRPDETYLNLAKTIRGLNL